MRAVKLQIIKVGRKSLMKPGRTHVSSVPNMVYKMESSWVTMYSGVVRKRAMINRIEFAMIFLAVSQFRWSDKFSQ